MELTGNDTIIFTFASPVLMVQSILYSFRSRFPAAEVDLEYVQPDLRNITNATNQQCLDAAVHSEHLILYLYSSPSLRDYLEEHGYTSSPNGEGPCALHIRRRRKIAFRLAGVNELYGNDGPVGPPFPYSGWLCSPLMHEITVVTPGEPDQDLASRQMVDLVINSCIEQEE